MVLRHWNTPRTCSHSTMEAMWTYKFHLCACNWKAHYIFYLARYYMYGVMWCSHQGDPFTMFIHTVRGVHWPELAVRHGCLSTSHHYHTESTLPHLYERFCHSIHAILQYSKTMGWTMRNRWHANGRQMMVAMMLHLFWLMTSWKSDWTCRSAGTRADCEAGGMSRIILRHCCYAILNL